MHNHIAPYTLNNNKSERHFVQRKRYLYVMAHECNNNESENKLYSVWVNETATECYIIETRKRCSSNIILLCFFRAVYTFPVSCVRFTILNGSKSRKITFISNRSITFWAEKYVFCWKTTYHLSISEWVINCIHFSSVFLYLHN